MSIVFAVLFFVVFIIVCRFLSRFFFRIGEHLDEKEKYNQYHDRIMRESLIDIRGSLVKPEEAELSTKERLLQANQKIAEKNSFNEALEKELGIY